MPPSNSGNLRIAVSTPPTSNRYYGGSTQSSPEMSENVPFLSTNARSSPNPSSRSAFSTPLGSPALRSSASNGSPYGNPNHLEESRYFSPPATPLMAAMSSMPTTVTRRSRARLLLLCLLAVIGFAAFIASMNAPEHVKAQAYDIVHKAGDSVKGGWDSLHTDEIWSGAKGWGGWGKDDGLDLQEGDVTGEASEAEQEKEALREEEIQEPSQTEEEETTPSAAAEEFDDAQDFEVSETESVEPTLVEETLGEPEATATTTEEVIPTAPVFAIPTKQAPVLSTGSTEKVVHPIYVLPDPVRLPKGGEDEQFFSYLPHSERIELANAMTLATMLNRTLLLPPVWIGWPVTTQPYQKLLGSWEHEMNEHRDAFLPRDPSALVKRAKKPPVVVPSIEECKSYAKECRSTYNDTFVAWSFLVDMGLVETRLPVVDRFNMTEEWAMEMTGATNEGDVYTLLDKEKYYFRFDDTEAEGEMIKPEDPTISKYLYSVSVPLLREATASHKLLMMGSIFGSGRLTLAQTANQRNLNFFHRSLAFRNAILETPANIIRDLMGGPKGYAGIHARVGDGAFKLGAAENMDITFTELMQALEVDKALIPDMLAKGKARLEGLKAEQEKVAAEKEALASANAKTKTRRQLKVQLESDSKWTMLDDLANDERSTMALPKKDHHALAKRQRLNNLGPIDDREDSPLSDTLTCRGELYTDSRYLALNNPVYLATDSPHPLEDPVLSNFWANLPCTFVLSDFDRQGPQNSGDPVESLRFMEGAINQNDGVKLGRLLLPFMEAAVAAKAAVTVGTRGSTFSGFAAGFLHDAYADDVAFASGDGKRKA